MVELGALTPVQLGAMGWHMGWFGVGRAKAETPPDTAPASETQERGAQLDEREAQLQEREKRLREQQDALQEREDALLRRKQPAPDARPQTAAAPEEDPGVSAVEQEDTGGFGPPLDELDISGIAGEEEWPPELTPRADASHDSEDADTTAAFPDASSSCSEEVEHAEPDDPDATAAFSAASSSGSSEDLEQPDATDAESTASFASVISTLSSASTHGAGAGSSPLSNDPALWLPGAILAVFCDNEDPFWLCQVNSERFMKISVTWLEKDRSESAWLESLSGNGLAYHLGATDIIDTASVLCTVRETGCWDALSDSTFYLTAVERRGIAVSLDAEVSAYSECHGDSEDDPDYDSDDSDYDDDESRAKFDQDVSELNEQVRQAHAEADAAERSISVIDLAAIDSDSDDDHDDEKELRRLSMEARDEAVARSKKEAEAARAEQRRLRDVAMLARQKAEAAAAKKAALLRQQEQRIRELRRDQAAAEKLAAEKVQLIAFIDADLDAKAAAAVRSVGLPCTPQLRFSAILLSIASIRVKSFEPKVLQKGYRKAQIKYHPDKARKRIFCAILY